MKRSLKCDALSLTRLREAGLIWPVVLALGFAAFEARAQYLRFPQAGDVFRDYYRPMFNGAEFRVTDPNAAFPAAQEYLPNPIMTLATEDLQGATRAELIIDYWGGHPGTQPRQFRFNSNAWINLPNLQTVPIGGSPNCYNQQVNFVVDVPLAHLLQGTNFLEGTSGGQVCNNFNWGQWGWQQVALRVYFNPATKPHPAGSITSPLSGSSFGENPIINVNATGAAGIAQIDFFAYFDGYDPDGDGRYQDWQVFYHRQNGFNAWGIGENVGSDTTNPYGATWDTTLVPDQAPGSIKLVAHVRDNNGYVFVTDEVTGLTLQRTSSSVRLYRSFGVPEVFWVRDNQTKDCYFMIPGDDPLGSISSARLLVRSYNALQVLTTVTVNSWVAPSFGQDHYVQYDKLVMAGSALSNGLNTFSVTNSDTVEHGTEIMWPGPALLVRYTTSPRSPTQLPAFYNFEEPSGNTIADVFGNGNAGQLVAPAARTASGQFGNAIAFNAGAGRVDLGALDLTGSALTISMWAYIDSATRADARLFAKALGTAQGDAYSIVGLANQNQVRFRLTTSAGTTDLVSNPILTLDAWNHVAVTYDGATMKILVNGVEQSSAAKIGTLVGGPNVPTYLGDNPGPDRRDFTGRLDEVRIYGFAQSAAQITTDMGMSIAGNIAPQIISPPANLTVQQPAAATFSVVASGSPTLTYQWYRGALAIAGATSASYTLNPTAVSADTGAQLKVVVSNAQGSVTSSVATLTVVQPAWWNAQWHYRVPITVDVSSYPRVDKPVNVAVNFTQLLFPLGGGTMNDTSIRVIEVSAAGAILDQAVPFQFDRDASYDATSFAKGTLVFMMGGNTTADTTRYFHVYFDTAGGFSPATVTPRVTLTDNIAHEGQSSYRIVTTSGTYYYHKQGAAFASMEDINGNDWLGFHPDPGSGAAGEYRGLPNMGDIAHPGFFNSTSTLLSQGPLKATIQSQSNDGLWKLIWEIYPGYATMTLLQAGANYWILYEGTPGGTFEPASDYWVRSSGETLPDNSVFVGDIPGPEWVYFGDGSISRVLFMAHHEDDSEPDQYWQLQNNMTVFGFGRRYPGSNVSSDRFLSLTPMHLTVGFGESAAGAPETINSAFRDLNVTIGTPASLSGAGGPAGLALWLRADQGLVLNGSSVTQWSDQSGNSRHATQAAASSKPSRQSPVLNGLPVVRFDGVDDFLTFTLPINGMPALSMFIVSANTQNQDGGISHAERSALFWNESSFWGTVFLSPFQNKITMRFGTGQFDNLMSYTRPASIGSAFSLTASVKNTTNDTLFVNGVAVLSQDGKLPTIASAEDTGSVGRGFDDNTFFAGDIAEIRVYSGALTAAQRQLVEQELSVKYGLGIPSPPLILVQPVDLTVAQPSPANFTVTAVGSSPLSYQWRRDGLPIGGATSSNYVVNPTSKVADTGAEFSVVVSNSLGMVTSVVATLTVGLPPNITQPPSSLVVTQGNAAGFTVTATGDDPLNYEWRRNGAAVSSSASSSYTINNAQPAQAGDYTVVVSNPFGAVTSAVATLTVEVLPFPVANLDLWLKADAGIALNGSSVSQWMDQSGNNRNATQGAGTSQPLFATSVLNGSPAVRFDGVDDFMSFNLPINGLTGMTIFLVAANTQNQNGGGGAEQAAIFWNETQFWGATYLSPFQNSVKLRFGTVQANNSMSYPRSASLDSAFSLTASIKDGDTDRLYVNRTLVLTESGKLSAIAGGRDIGNLARGYDDNTFFAGDIAEVLVYTRALDNAERQAVEQYLDSKYLLTGPAAPSIITDPADVVVEEPDQAVFNVQASGTSPLTYRWRRNGANINGATSASYTLNPTALADNGAPFDVVVSNAYGMVTSMVATLTVYHLSISCVADKTVPCGSIWAFDAPTATNGCAPASVSILSTVTNASPCGQTFTATRTWEATHGCGSPVQCSQTVTVVDTTPPALSCVSDKSAECGTVWTFDAPASSDACGGTTVIVLTTVTNAGPGGTFTATRTWRATDACNNQAMCSQIVTVTDTTAPVVTCVANKSVECGSAWTFDAPSASDVCGSVTISILTTVTNAGPCGLAISATRTWQATDAVGNQSQCSQTVTTTDTTAPIFTCLGNKSVECGAAWTFDDPTASDTCGSATITILTTVTNTGAGGTYTATRTWQAADACNNQATCSQAVTAADTTAPVINCVANKSVECGSAWTFDAPTASDTCSSATVIVLSTVTNAGPCGLAISATRTWQATDAVGNQSQCSQTVTTTDTTAPIITCLANKSADCGSTWDFDEPTGSDTCGGVTTVIVSTMTNTLADCSFTVTRTWRAIDACQNESATCSQTVSVTAPPRLSIQREGDLVRLSWPAADSGYVLETSQELGSGDWIEVSEPPVVEGGENVVTLTTVDAGRFYRLRKPASF